MSNASPSIPEVSIHQLPDMFIVVARGRVGKVKICSPEVFRLRVQQAIMTVPVKRRSALVKSLLEDPNITYAPREKDEFGMHDRFFAVSELDKARAEPFVYSSYVDDRDGPRSRDNKLY